MRILCVDDEPLILSALRRILGDHEVVCYDDPCAAIDHLKSVPPPQYDVIVCDVIMPHCSGVDVHGAVYRGRPELLRRMIFLTGASMPGIDAFFVDSGCQRIGKPFEVDELLDAIWSATGVDPRPAPV